jgi:hypothetical protein
MRRCRQERCGGPHGPLITVPFDATYARPLHFLGNVATYRTFIAVAIVGEPLPGHHWILLFLSGSSQVTGNTESLVHPSDWHREIRLYCVIRPTPGGRHPSNRTTLRFSTTMSYGLMTHLSERGVKGQQNGERASLPYRASHFDASVMLFHDPPGAKETSTKWMGYVGSPTPAATEGRDTFPHYEGVDHCARRVVDGRCCYGTNWTHRRFHSCLATSQFTPSCCSASIHRQTTAVRDGPGTWTAKR